MSHLDQLRRVFGPEHVMGGVAHISVTLMPDGVVRHLTPLNRFAFGDLDGHLSSRVLALQAALSDVPVQAEAVPDIVPQTWRSWSASEASRRQPC